MNADQSVEERAWPQRTAHGQLDITALRSRVTDLAQHARAVIRQQPVVAVLAAAGAGYLAARLVSRGRRYAR